jgi:hypothetical protein
MRHMAALPNEVPALVAREHVMHVLYLNLIGDAVSVDFERKLRREALVGAAQLLAGPFIPEEESRVIV